jgi:N-glycosylase/DNA lyase
MRIIVEALPGMRILRQPPVECLFSFICSSNNNISRITLMLEKLRQRYGTKINVNDALSSPISSSLSSSSFESSQTISTFYSFPTVEALSAASEEDLRGLGLGYRAKFVRATAIALSSKGGEEFLMSLRSKPRKEVQVALLEFVGVGMKVADCVALFSLDQSDCIPVDTHVWNIACCYFDRTLVNHKSLTPTVYEKVGDIFRTRYGASHAGWAHSLLFAAELPSFRSKLPSGMQSEMTQFKDDEKARKADATAEKKKRKKQQEEGKEVDEQEVVEKEE